MDRNTLNQLLTAKRLLAIAEQQSRTGDRFAASVGIVTLQDSIELVLIACLNGKKFGKAFPELLKGVEDDGHQILHKSSLLALNNFRVAIKHHGGVIDQQNLKESLNNAIEAIDHLVISVFGKPYHEIYSAELILHPESKALLVEVAQNLEIDSFNSYECLINIRKAIFINFEEEYSIEEWKDHSKEQPLSLVESLIYKHKAPFYTRNKEWIEKNVMNIFDYIQIDHDQLSINLMQYGISLPTFFNLLRLTPQVFRFIRSNKWKRAGNFAFINTSKEIVYYCLSTAIEMIYLKENYLALHSSAPDEFKMEIQSVQSTFLYKKASTDSEKLKSIERGEIFFTNAFVPGFEDESLFVVIYEFRDESKPQWLKGYIPADHVDRYKSSEDEETVSLTYGLVNNASGLQPVT